MKKQIALAYLLPAVLAANEASRSDFAERQTPYFSLMKVEEGWKITRGGPGCIVGVIDSGFDFFHPAFRGNLKPGWFAPNVYHTPHLSMVAHGTMVASLISARRKEGEDGMWGLAPGCSILAASQGLPIHSLLQFQREFFAKNPNATVADLQKEMVAHASEVKAFGDVFLNHMFGTTAEAVRYLADEGVRIISISIDLSLDHVDVLPAVKRRLEAAFEYAKQRDVLIVIGAGNTDQRVEDYPGDASFVMVAGAATLEGQRWSITSNMYGTDVKQGSCYGPRLSVMAPTENLVLALPHEEAFYSWKDTPVGEQRTTFEGQYEVHRWGATSSAVPQVAALAALVRFLRPDLKASDIIRLIEQGADTVGSPGFHEDTGYGRINFLKTLKLAREFAAEVKRQITVPESH